jgi:hypothetical protein
MLYVVYESVGIHRTRCYQTLVDEIHLIKILFSHEINEYSIFEASGARHQLPLGSATDVEEQPMGRLRDVFLEDGHLSQLFTKVTS